MSSSSSDFRHIRCVTLVLQCGTSDGAVSGCGCSDREGEWLTVRRGTDPYTRARSYASGLCCILCAFCCERPDLRTWLKTDRNISEESASSIFKIAW
jgi:hypothetical protein